MLELLLTVDVPFIGEIDTDELPAIVATLLIGFIDGFNPCSLWVLSVLLGLVVHVSRKRVLLVGITFLVTTATVYGVFIAGVLGIMTILENIELIRFLVAVFALTFALVSIKDFIWFNRGVSFTIPDQYKPEIYRKIRRIPEQGGYGATIVATIIIAVGVAFVELPCTAGFPVIWSNMIAEQSIGTTYYIILLLLYVFVYLFIELLIFVTVLFTMERFKFKEKYGRILKLIGGNIMLFLAIALLFAPTLIEDAILTTVGFIMVIVISLLISLIAERAGYFDEDS